MIRSPTRLLLAVLAGATAPAALAGESNSASCPESEYRPIRGYCSADYLRIDVLWEAVREIRRQAFRRFFTLDLDTRGPDVQILHDEDPSRGREWRGEFMVRITGVAEGMLRAEFWRAREPLQAQLHQLVHQRLYGRIADAFAKTDLKPDSDAWAARVRALVPPQNQLLDEIQIDQFSASAEGCPELSVGIDRLRTLTLPAPLHSSGMDGVLGLSFHPEWYEIVVNSFARLVHVRDEDDRNPYFTWAEEMVGALDPCWKPDAGE